MGKRLGGEEWILECLFSVWSIEVVWSEKSMEEFVSGVIQTRYFFKSCSLVIVSIKSKSNDESEKNLQTGGRGV